ncbi:hypothetical protein BN136_72 [Cronobacter universalis NCTC 9529]|nr:hypothetical protein BN136_72 [Cronobacter universalis NCTC 9529]
MVRVHFFVIPAAVAALRIDRGLRQEIRRVYAYRLQHRMAAREVFFRQVAAVGARIRNEFVGFVQLLADIQHHLRAQVETSGGLDLQRREGERQRRGFAFALVVVAGDNRRLSFNALNDMLRQRAVEEPPFFILIRLAGLARLPERGEALLRGRNDVRFDLKEIFGDEVFNLFVAPHHQPQHGRLDAAYREHALIARVLPEQRPGARHVNAVQPVGAGAGERRGAERHELAVLSQLIDGALHRLRVEIVNQATTHLLALFRGQLQVVEHFVHQQLPFAIRVACVNNLLRLAQQLFNHIELLCDRRFRLKLPLFRHDG